jgi:hypothetical protein
MQLPSLYLIQWGIVGFFVVIHLLIGFLRGGSKSTYFSIISLILTVVTLWIVSTISLNFIFNTFLTVDSLVTLIQGYSGNMIPEEFIAYILNPSLLAFAIAIIDLVIRIVAFFLFYPFLKWSLTMTIFRPIWKRVIKKSILKKQNEKDQLKFEENPKNQKKFVKSKRLHKPILGRLFGASMGALRGFVVGFVFLIPILVISGFVSGISALTINQDGTYSLGSDAKEIVAIPNEVMDILLNIEEMNQKGLGALTSQIVISGKSIDRLIFDMVFTTKVVDSGEKVGEISLGQEFESIIGIAQILIQGGYLEDDFAIETISSDNLEDIEQIMGLLGKSSLLKTMIPLATRFGVSSILPDYINGVNLYDRPSTATALDKFTSIDWENEFNNFYGIIEAVLEFGSVSELMAYADDPLLLLELTPDEAQKFTDIIRAFGKLETLYLLNVAVDFASSYGTVQDLITWIEPSEREAYLQERLGFILDNPNFFITTTNEDDELVEGEIGRIANFIESFYTDDYGDVDFRALVESINNPQEFIELQNPDWVGYLIEQLVEIELLIEMIPFGVDYGIYNVLGNDLDQEMADNIASALSETEWDAEFINVGEIYRNVLMLGIGSVLGDNPDYYAFIDSVVQDHMDSVRAIVENIFEKSTVVNAAIEYATPYLLDTLVEDEALRNLVSSALISDSDSGIVDFNFGAEINRILTIVETVYGFTTTSELVGLSSMTVDEQLNVVAKFGALPQADYDQFIEAIESMQLFNRIGKSGLEYIVSTRDIPQLYIPEEVDLGSDLGSLFNLVYYAANYLYQESMLIPLIEDVDFAPLLADPVFRSYLLPTELNNHSNLITSNIAHNILLYATDENMSNYLAIPASLANLSPESEAWQSEVANLLGAVFDLGSFFGGSDTIKLSARELITLSADPTQAPLTLITQFSDENMTKARQAFGNLDESLVFRSSISKAIESFGTQSLSFIEGYELSFPEIAMEDGIVKKDMFVELIYGLATLIDGLNQTLAFEKIADFQANEDNYLYVNAYNQIDEDALVTFSSITVLRGIISDLFLSESLQAYVRDTLNGSGTLQVSDSFFTFEREDDLLTVEDVSGLFISIKSLQMTPEFYANPGDILPFISTLDKTKLTGFFDSTIIREIFTQVFTDEGLLSFGVDTVNNMQAIIVLSDDFFSVDEAVMIEDGLIKTEELVNLFIAVQALGLDSAEALSSLNESTFANLVDPATQDEEGKDDLDRVLASHYIYIILDRAFALEGISSFAGTTLGIGSEDDPINLNPPAAIKVNDPLNIIEHNRLPKAEFRRLFTSISMLGDTSELGDPSAIITIMTDMIGRDIDSDTGEDDFDRFLSSDYLYFLIDVVLKNQEMLSVPLLALDTVFPYEGYIKKTEIRDMLNTLIILDITNLDGIDTDSITIQDLINVLDETNSAIVQYLLSQAIITALDPNGEGKIPADAYFGNVEDGMLTIEEINAIVQALLILSGDEPDTPLTGIDFTAITVGQVDQLSQSESVVIKQLVTDEIKKALDPDDEGKIPADAYDGTRLSQSELNALVVALLVLANQIPSTLVTDISTDVTVGQVIELRDGTGDPLEIRGLDSLIIQQLISDEAITLLGADNIPDEAYFDAEKTRLTKVELGYMIEAIVILTGDKDPALTYVVDLNTNEITVGQVKEMNELDSNITKKLISTAIIDQLDPDDEGKIPLDAYDLEDPTRLSDAELNAMVVALKILANHDPDLLVTLISTDVTVAQVSEFKGTGDPSETKAIDSYTIKQLITDEIEVVITTIPDEAYVTPLERDILTDDEITKMIEALEILAGDSDPTITYVGDLSTDVTIGQVTSLNALGSIITDKLISDSIVDAIDPDDEGKVPNEAYLLDTPGNNLKPAEVIEMIEALRILAGKKTGDLNALTDDVVLSTLEIEPTIGQVKLLNALTSSITAKLISDSIIEAVGVDSVPDDAYVLSTPGNLLTAQEVLDMIAALEILAGKEDGDPEDIVDDVELIDIETRVTVAQTQDLKTNGSKIIKQIISDAIVEMLDSELIPLGAYNTTPGLNRLSDSEIKDMIDSLFILANGDDSAYVDEIVFDESTFTVTTLKSFPDSLIMNRIISSGLITNMPNIPDESYLILDPLDAEVKLDILRIEIDNVLDALTTLGIDDPSGADNIGTDQITFAKLDEIILLGTVGSANEHLEGYSPIINHILSTPMIAAVTREIGGHNYGIPSTSLVNDNDLLYNEVKQLVEALKLIGNVGEGGGQADPETTTIFDVADTLDPSVFGPALLSDLIDLDSLVVYRMISLGIQDANIANSDAYAVVPDYNYDPELPDAPAYEDIKIAEMEHLVVAMNILGVVELDDILAQITVANLQALTPAEIETLVEAGTNGPNTIIYYIISETIDPDNDVYDTLVLIDPITYPGPADDYYELDGLGDRIRLKRTSIADALAAL